MNLLALRDVSGPRNRLAEEMRDLWEDGWSITYLSGQDKMVRLALVAGCLTLAVSCSRTGADQQAATSDTVSVLCAIFPDSLVVSADRVGPFRTDATLASIQERCPGARTDIYSFGGIQGPSWHYRFAGAEITAVQFGCPDEFCPGKPPDLWEATGDSIRLPDGSLVPRTVGEMRRRYGPTLVIRDDEGDEIYVCRIPQLHFAVRGPLPATVTVTPTLVERAGVADTTQIGKVRLWKLPARTTDRFCPPA